MELHRRDTNAAQNVEHPRTNKGFCFRKPHVRSANGENTGASRQPWDGNLSQQGGKTLQTKLLGSCLIWICCGGVCQLRHCTKIPRSCLTSICCAQDLHTGRGHYPNLPRHETRSCCALVKLKAIPHFASTLRVLFLIQTAETTATLFQ